VLPFPELDSPTSVAVDAAGSVYVTDQRASRVLMLAAGATTATVLPFAGLAEPTAVAVDAAGNVYVTDRQTDRVSMLPAKSRKTKVLRLTNVRPGGIAVDAADRLHVTSGNKLLRLAGRFTKPTVLPFMGSFWPQSVVAVNAVGNVYVGDHGCCSPRPPTPR
jgi:serine/threonine-protein kinase